MPKSPSVSVLDVLRRQEEQSQLADLGFPPMLRLDAEEEQQQNGERQSQGQGKEHGIPEEGGRVGERERDFAAAESEGERTRESTSRNIDGCCNVQGGEEEDVEEEEEGEEVEEEKDDEEGGGSYQGPRIAGLEPMNFVTLASPHLGSRGKGHLPFLPELPFLLKVSLFEKASVPLAPLFLGRSARHLFLTDVDPPVKTTDVDPPVETTDVGPRIHPSNVNPQISTADADPRVDSTGGTEPQSETTGTNARIDTTSAGRQPSTAGVDPLSDALGAAVAGDIHVDAAKVNPSTGRVDPLNAKSGKYLPLNTNTTLSSSVDAGHPFAELSAQPAAEALAVGAESNLGHATVKEKKQQQPHGMVRLHRLGSSLIDVTRVAAAEGHSEETPETGVGSRKEKHQLPLLLRMTTDNEEGPFLSALAAFKYRAAYANVLGDRNATSEASGAPPGAPSGGPSGAPSGGPSGAPSGGPSDGPAAGDAPEPKEHTNFFARLKGRWKVGGGTAATPGFGLGFGFGSPQQQFLPFKQQPLKLKEKGHTEQGEEGEQAFENNKKSPDDPPEGPPEEGEEGRLQLVRSMSEGMVPRGASGRGSGSGGSSGEGSGNSRTGQGAMKNDIGHGSDEGWCGEENKARRASIGGPAAAAAAAAAGGAGGAGAAMLPRTAGIAPKKHSIQMQWEGGFPLHVSVDYAMVDNLNRVPWARIDVNFASSPLAFLAHILIQVNIPTLKAHGASVIQHVIDNFVV
ncbi:unnamed protein product [Closterium sp. NIES-65]|nr:unnamed protein product [Closterium sp. NIES-65]